MSRHSPTVAEPMTRNDWMGAVGADMTNAPIETNLGMLIERPNIEVRPQAAEGGSK